MAQRRSCGITTLTLDKTKFYANVGANTVTLTVTDKNGNVY
jgi:PKD repeat protein